jgi:hypothetical protein
LLYASAAGTLRRLETIMKYSSVVLTVSVILSLMCVATPAAAEECTYNDLHSEFTIKADCAGLQDFSGIAQHHKRLWLSGPWGQLEIMEVPSPYQAVELDVVMKTLARYWSPRRTPGALSATTLAGMDARVVTERKLRTTSRTWAFNFGGRNITARAVAYGKKKEREANLELIAKAFVESFSAKTK